MTKEKLRSQGFQDIVDNSGACVMELKLTESQSLRTWGHTEQGEVWGMYFYNQDTDQYSEPTSFI